MILADLAKGQSYCRQTKKRVGIHLSNDFVTLGFLLPYFLSLVLVFLQTGITLSNNALDLEFSGFPLYPHPVFWNALIYKYS